MHCKTCSLRSIRSVRKQSGRQSKTERRSSPRVLRACYRNSLELAARNGCRSVAFPCVSTGVYGYPRAEAARIAVETVRGFLRTRPEIDVVFCCFLAPDKDEYDRLLGAS